MSNQLNHNPWQDLISKINPEFLKENGELIAGLIKTFTDQNNTSSNAIELDELGIKDPEELYNLLDVVPEYNDLVDENNQLEREYQMMEQEFNHLKQENAKLLATVRKAKKIIKSLKAENQKFIHEKQLAESELRARDQFINKFNLTNNNGSHPN